MNTLSSYIESPIGYWKISQKENKISGIQLCEHPQEPQTPKSTLLDRACTELLEYFNGHRKSFDWPLDLEAHPPFYQVVWKELLKVPFGKTSYYEQIALDLNNIKAIRAVGMANGKNPFPIVVPCHRILGKDKSLTGYAYGLDIKRWLLEHEGIFNKQMNLFS